MSLARYGLLGDTYGGFGDTYGEHIVVPTLDDTPFATSGILGCTRSYQCFIADRSGQTLLFDLPFTDLTWERVESETSKATAEAKGISGVALSECCTMLEDVDAWSNELHIYRNAERVWRGPIVGMGLDDSGFSLQAEDISAWLAERRLHSNHSHAQVDLAIIFAEYISDAMSVDPIPNLTVAAGRAGVYGTRVVKARDRKIARAEIDELARTGISWTVLDGTMIVTGVAPVGDPLSLYDVHFQGIGKVTVDGSMATEVTVLGSGGTSSEQGPVGVAVTPDPAIIERYGVHEVVVSETTIKDPESAFVAARNRLGRLARPAALFSGGQLTDDFPLTQNEIVPGLSIDAHLVEQCRVVDGAYRLTKVSGKFGSSTDVIEIDVQPPGEDDR
jgi:hypothetical protein